MNQPQYRGYLAPDAEEEEPLKHIFHLQLRALDEWPTALNLPSRRFALFLAGGDASHTVLERVAESSITQGCVLVSAQGSLEKPFEDYVVRVFPEATEDDFVLTGVGFGDDLRRALYDFLFVWKPATAYEQSCQTWLVCTFGNPGTHSAIAESLSDVQKLHDDVLEEFVASLPEKERFELQEEPNDIVEFVPATDVIRQPKRRLQDSKM